MQLCSSLSILWDCLSPTIPIVRFLIIRCREIDDNMHKLGLCHVGVLTIHGLLEWEPLGHQASDAHGLGAMKTKCRQENGSSALDGWNLGPLRMKRRKKKKEWRGGRYLWTNSWSLCLEKAIVWQGKDSCPGWSELGPPSFSSLGSSH